MKFCISVDLSYSILTQNMGTNMSGLKFLIFKPNV